MSNMDKLLNKIGGKENRIELMAYDVGMY